MTKVFAWEYFLAWWQFSKFNRILLCQNMKSRVLVNSTSKTNKQKEIWNSVRSGSVHFVGLGLKHEIFHLILGTPRVTLFAGKGTDWIANGQTKNDMVMTPITALEKPLFSGNAQCSRFNLPNAILTLDISELHWL